MVVGSSLVAVIYTSNFAPASSKEFLDIQATTERGFTLRRVRDMIRTYSRHLCMGLDRFDDYYNNNLLDKLSKENEGDGDGDVR